MLEAVERLRQTFRHQFGGEPEVIARAPGRVNLIGEHTDYNDGFVLPVAIDREVRVAARRRGDSEVHLFAASFGRSTEFRIDDIQHHPRERWSNYERGVALMLQRRGFHFEGFDAVVEGDVPAGAGLSSSAAVEVATGTAISALFGLDVDPVQLALLSQQAENEFVGVNCGIMDQFISALGRRDHALFLDCRSLETRHVPLRAAGAAGATGLTVEGNAGAQIVVADTAVKRGLVDSEYNRRRAECEEAVRRLSHWLPGIKALRDVTPEQLERHSGELPEVVHRRARHVVTENARVLASVDALIAGDLPAFGRLMDESHVSLRDDYEVTVPQLDVMVAAAHAVPGVLGSRMTGAGFGGCTVSLVRADAVVTFTRDVPQAYRAQTGLDPNIYVCRAVDGATVLTQAP
ncbi:MAG: galactokinase [Chloroflexota bacterium]|nr:galactokinase [Chloroflexota bacterium]